MALKNHYSFAISAFYIYLVIVRRDGKTSLHRAAEPVEHSARKPKGHDLKWPTSARLAASKETQVFKRQFVLIEKHLVVLHTE